MSQIKDLSKRVHNLEIVVVGVYSINTNPEFSAKEKEQKTTNLMQNFFNHSTSLDGCKKGNFKGKK